MNTNDKPSKKALSEPYCKTDVSGSYTGTQTPIERLRNKLSPFINLAEVLHRDKDFNVDGLIKACNLYKNDIHIHLSDCEKFYQNREIDFAIWINKNEFFNSNIDEWKSGMGTTFTTKELYVQYLQNTSK